MLRNLKTKLIAGLMAFACAFAGAGFGVAVEGVSADVGVENTSSVT